MASKKATEQKKPHQQQAAEPQKAKAPDIDPGLFSADDTTGYYEGMDSGAYAVPFLGVLQGLSPAVQRGRPDAIPGALPGQILNTVTKRTFDKVIVTVLRRSHTLTWWTPRDKGGGFLREEEAHAENMAEFARMIPDDKRRRINKAGEEVVEYRNFWCSVFDGIEYEPESINGKTGEVSPMRFSYQKIEPAIIGMKGTQLGVARNLNTNIDIESAKIDVVLQDASGARVKAKRPVLHSGIWEMGTILKTKGENTWFLWTFKFLGLHNDRATLIGVRDKVQLAKSQNTIARQLEQHIAEPSEVGEGEM